MRPNSSNLLSYIANTCKSTQLHVIPPTSIPTPSATALVALLNDCHATSLCATLPTTANKTLALYQHYESLHQRQHRHQHHTSSVTVGGCCGMRMVCWETLAGLQQSPDFHSFLLLGPPAHCQSTGCPTVIGPKKIGALQN